MTTYRRYLLLLLMLLFITAACRRDDPPATPVSEVTPTADGAVSDPTAQPEPTQTPAPQLIGNLDGAPGLYPRLLGQNPASGAELAPGEAIELYFDQPMDVESTTAALSVTNEEGETVAGEISWPQPRILRFKPAGTLPSDTTLLISLAAEAVSEEGIALQEGLTLDIQTVGDLELSAVSPSPDTVEIASDSAITVIFNRPVVPLTIKEEQDQLPDPLSFTPAIEGNGEWINTSVYVFRPTRPLIGRQTYTASLEADIINEASVNGAQLADDFSWRFTVTAPTLSYLSLPDLASYVNQTYKHLPLDQSFEVFFNQPMDTVATENAISVSSDRENVPLTFEWNQLQTSVVFTPTRLLETGTVYAVTVSDSARSDEGGLIANGETWRMETVAYPEILSTTPADGTTQDRFRNSFRIDFASPMSFDSLKGKVTFDPPLQGDPDGFYNQWSWRYTFYGLQPSTDYTVSIAPGMADPYGNVVDTGQIIRFRTSPYTPSATVQMHQPFALYRQGGTEEMWVAFRNAETIEMRLSELTVDQFSDLLYLFNPRAFDDARLPQVWRQEVDVSTGEENLRDFVRFELANIDATDLDLGLYFVTVNGSNVPTNNNLHADARPIILANANVTLKLTTTEILMWVTDLESGEPLGGVPVTLYDRFANPVLEGTTDNDGLFYASDIPLIEDYEDRFVAVAEGQGVFGIAVSEWSEGINPYEFGINTDFYLQPDQINTYIYTDRPLYRPGQEVFFKGILRTNDDLNFDIPVLESAWVEISSFEGVVFESELPLNAFGTLEGTFELDDEAVLGGYNIQILDERDGDWLGSTYFDVAEYRKPTFAVDVNPASSDLSQGESLQATIEANFFSGGSVANADTEWYLSVVDTVFRPTDRDLQRYSFDNRELDAGYYYRGYFGSFGETVATGRGKTDRFGRLPVDISLEGAATNTTQEYTLEGVVTDLAGNVVAGRTTVTVHPSELYGGIRPGSRVAQAGQEIPLEIVVVDWDEQIQPNTTVTIEVVERRWFSVQEEDETGRVIWTSTVEEIPVAEFTDVVTGSDGKAQIDFTPPAGGVYRASVIVEDTAGRESLTSTYFWAAGDEFVPWRRSSDHSFELISDASSYTPGDTAEILIASPFQGDAYALVTVERGHITRQDVIELTDNSTIYTLPISGEMAPNIFVSVLIVKGVDETTPAPDFKYGILQFDVERTEQELQIDIQPDRQQLGPGDTVNYAVRVTDAAGRPVEAELSLALVDLALLSLQAEARPTLLDYFYSQRWLSVRTSLLLTKEMDSFNQELQDEFKGGGGGGGDFGVIEVREEFKDTAFWSAQIQTDSSGTANVTIDLPDNLTTWRMDARAVTLDTRVGQATADIQTTLPLLVEPQTPRFFVVGDEAAVGAMIRNTTNSEIEVTATIEADGVLLATTAVQEVSIPPSGAVFVVWKVVVEDTERVDFLFQAEGGGFADASRPTLGTLEGNGIPVYRYETPETVGTSGQLLDEGVIVESLALPIFPGYTPTNGEVNVELSPSLAAAMTEGLDYLQHYPYECTEQIISKFLPNVMTTRALEAAGLTDPALEAELEQQVNIALQRIYSRQRSNGGWGWWSNSPTNNLVTAYVVLGMYEAQQAGYSIRQEVLLDGLNYLAVNFDRDGERLNERARLNREAFVTYVLAHTGRQPTAEINALYDERPKLDLYARSLLARAMHELDEGDPRLETLKADLNSAAILSATGAHWEEERLDYRNWNTDTRTTGMVIGTMAMIDPENPLVANGVRWLMAHRTSGRWRSTQETAWVLMGLTDWMVASGELEADFVYEVGLNGDLLGSGEATAESLRTPLEIKTSITELLTDELNRLAIGRTGGPGNLYYTAHMNIYLPVDQLEPLDSGVIVSRSYYRVDDPLTPITEFEQGETVMARLTIIAPNSLHYLLVDDWLPAGMEAIDSTLQTSEQVGLPDPYELNSAEFGVNGWGWWYFDHIQLRDEKVVLSSSFLPQGTYEYTYLARAVTPGTFRVLPPTAQEFYFPEVYGRGAGSEIAIYPKGDLPNAPVEAGEPQRVEFEPGAISAELSGEVTRENSQVYVLRALDGQTMTVSALAAGSDVVFSVKSEDGLVLGETTADAPLWSGTLPAAGDYLIEVRSVAGDASYALAVTIE
ncbi:MAG: Ig-like domain-containing protein [Ardenticatenaceae bacterium]|nr:Ig-like domain-containing protein [Ardenticatenaceae bacterium]